MKAGTLLKYVRRILAGVFGVMLLLLFLDFTRTVPLGFHRLAHVQLIPALMNGMFGLVLLLVVVTLLFGRVYCSVLCPLGIMQDVILRIKKWFYRARKQKKKLRTRYERQKNILRYTLLGLTVAAFLLGWTALILWLDPYSNFGRIAAAVFKPIAIAINNGLSVVLNKFGIYSVYYYEINYLNGFLFAFGLGLLTVITVLVWRRQRIWCNTMCPVGTFLGLISRYSLFRVSIDESQCNRCKNCSSNCKSRCIDESAYKVDGSRCVGCYNCLDVCNKNAIHYKADGWSRKKRKADKITPAAPEEPSLKVQSPEKEKEAALNPFQLSRRRFVQGTALTLVTLPLAAYARKEEPSYEVRNRYPLPPGATPGFHRKCTGCQLCVSQCPMQVLRPAFLEHGLQAMMQPLLYFHPHCYCNYECTVCGDVCPNGAIGPLTVEEKRLKQIGEVHFIENECIVKTEDQDCGACAEHCPTQAVHMVPYHNGLTIPAIDPAICVGCGACESICPVRPKAIFVEGHTEQRDIDPALLEDSGNTQEIDLDKLFDNVFGGEADTDGPASLADTVKNEDPPVIDFGF